MLSVGIRELKTRASDLVRLVRENGEDVQVTYRGRAVARLTPIMPVRSVARDTEGVWTDLDRLAVEIGLRWPNGVSAAEAVSAERREL